MRVGERRVKLYLAGRVRNVQENMYFKQCLVEYCDGGRHIEKTFLYSDGTANYKRKQIMDNSCTVVIELSMLYPQM